MSIDVQRLTTYLAGALIMFFLGVVVNHFFERKKEYRDYSKWQFGNLKDLFFEKYLSTETRSYREKVINPVGEIDSISTEKLTIAIQHLGFSAYLGLIPLEPVLSGNGPQVVSDFILVKDHIDKIRGNEVDNNKIPFISRHGEWLACLCYMWICYQKFELPEEDFEYLEIFISRYGGLKGVSKREKLLFESEIELVKEHTKYFTNKIRHRYFLHRIYKALRD